MALRVLDGNQTATTLSSVVTGGEHIVAHSVVSLGANAIANITSAVSGSVVSVSNFPASQSTTFGAVTGSVSVLNFPSTQIVAGTVTANVGFSSNVGEAVPEQAVLIAYNTNNFMEAVGENTPLPISGTVTANVPLVETTDSEGSPSLGFAGIYAVGRDWNSDAAKNFNLDESGQVRVASLPAISGTVTANGGNFLNSQDALITKDSASNLVLLGGLSYNATPTQSAVDALVTDGEGRLIVYPSQTSWTDTNQGNQPRAASQQTPFPVQVLGGSVTIGSLPAISGTVTVGAMPNGTLTTRFGTPTTANTAFATSAVTNTSRKYLLIQNVTTGSNVITVGIGFTPTTTQGIQLTAGAGITFESSYIPTGAVQILSSVTASNFTILEA